MPKNVATSMAHSGVWGRDASATAGGPLAPGSLVILAIHFRFSSSSLIFVFWTVLADGFLGIGYGRRNYITPAGPFAEIEQAAAVAAEWKIGFVSLGRFLADRTAEFDRTLSRHMQVYTVERRRAAPQQKVRRFLLPSRNHARRLSGSDRIRPLSVRFPRDNR